MKPHIIIMIVALHIISVPCNSQVTIRSDRIESNNLISKNLQKDVSFPGGDSAWKKFLMKNLNSYVPADNDAPVGKYIIRVRFAVDTTGSISDIRSLTNLGYGMEQEVIRIVQLSGRWEPALANGIPVSAFHELPVTFLVIDDQFEVTSKIPFMLFTDTDNELTVTVEGAKKEDVQLTISEGNISIAPNGNYIAKVGRPGRVVIKLFNTNTNETIGEASFEVSKPSDKPAE